jgi:hypothetical protein
MLDPRFWDPPRRGHYVLKASGALSSLRHLPPMLPSRPVSCDVVAVQASAAPEDSAGLVAPPTHVEDEAVLLGGVTMHLDGDGEMTGG